MGKFDEVMRSMGDTINGSLGVGRTPGTLPPGMDPSAAQRAPSRAQGVTRSKNAVEVPTDKIQRDDDQPREDFDSDSLERLAESLRTRGQLQPIRVRWDECRGVYVIVCGERRWRAAKMAGVTSMSCVVHEGPVAPTELLALQLIENALREDLKPVEAAKAYRRLMDTHKWSGHQLARELNIAQSAVSQTLALLDLPESVQARVDAGDLAARAAYELSKLPDAAIQAEVADQVLAEGLPLAQVAEVVKARKAGRPAVVAARREVKLPDGTRVTFSGPGAAGPDALVAATRAVLRVFQAELKQAGPGQAA